MLQAYVDRRTFDDSIPHLQELSAVLWGESDEGDKVMAETPNAAQQDQTTAHCGLWRRPAH